MIEKWCSHCTDSHQHHPQSNGPPVGDKMSRRANNNEMLLQQSYSWLYGRPSWCRTDRRWFGRSSDNECTSSSSNPSHQSTHPQMHYSGSIISGKQLVERLYPVRSVSNPSDDCPEQQAPDTACCGHLHQAESKQDASPTDTSSSCCGKSTDPFEWMGNRHVVSADDLPRPANLLTVLNRTRKKREKERRSSTRSVWSAAMLSPFAVVLTVLVVCGMLPIRGVAAQNTTLTPDRLQLMSPTEQTTEPQRQMMMPNSRYQTHMPNEDGSECCYFN